jgi:elongator complex protein 3
MNARANAFSARMTPACPRATCMVEPGAMRGMQNDFDPYRQVASRLEALDAVGHPIDKIELLILGGTFTAYSTDYQEWFIPPLL